MAIEIQQAWLVIRPGQRQIKLMIGVSTRGKMLTEKGRGCRPTLLKERREKINKRMMRKCSEDLLFSNKNRITVEEELAQFNDLFKMLLSIHEDIIRCLMMTRELMRMTGLMSWIIRFAISRGRFRTG